jgi:hypothetical protein
MSRSKIPSKHPTQQGKTGISTPPPPTLCLSLCLSHTLSLYIYGAYSVHVLAAHLTSVTAAAKSSAQRPLVTTKKPTTKARSANKPAPNAARVTKSRRRQALAAKRERSHPGELIIRIAVKENDENDNTDNKPSETPSQPTPPAVPDIENNTDTLMIDPWLWNHKDVFFVLQELMVPRPTAQLLLDAGLGGEQLMLMEVGVDGSDLDRALGREPSRKKDFEHYVVETTIGSLRACSKMYEELHRKPLATVGAAGAASA